MLLHTTYTYETREPSRLERLVTKVPMSTSLMPIKPTIDESTLTLSNVAWSRKKKLQRKCQFMCYVCICTPCFRGIPEPSGRCFPCLGLRSKLEVLRSSAVVEVTLPPIRWNRPFLRCKLRCYQQQNWRTARWPNVVRLVWLCLQVKILKTSLRLVCG